MLSATGTTAAVMVLTVRVINGRTDGRRRGDSAIFGSLNRGGRLDHHHTAAATIMRVAAGQVQGWTAVREIVKN